MPAAPSQRPRPMMGSKSTRKGKKAERDVCAILREYGPWPNAERDLDQARTVKCEACDGEGKNYDPSGETLDYFCNACGGKGHLLNGRDIVNTEPVVIQVKQWKRITSAVIEAGLHEAEDSKDHSTDYAACVHRSDRAAWRVTLTVGDLTDLGGGRTTFGEMADALVEMDLVEWCRLCGEVMR